MLTNDSRRSIALMSECNQNDGMTSARAAKLDSFFFETRQPVVRQTIKAGRLQGKVQATSTCYRTNKQLGRCWRTSISPESEDGQKGNHIAGALRILPSRSVSAMTSPSTKNVLE